MFEPAHGRLCDKILAKYSRQKPKKIIRFRGGKVLVYTASQHKTKGGQAFNRFIRLLRIKL